MQEYNIFVSYSRIDHALVECVVSLLRAIGAQAFRDADSIPAGIKWRPVLEQALDQATVILVFWCTHSESSTEVRKEWQRAIDGQKRLVPVILDDTPLNPDLSQFQGIDMRPIIGDHRKDSIPAGIDQGNYPRQSWERDIKNFAPGHDSMLNLHDLMSNLRDLASHTHLDEEERRKKVFDEVARRIYDCIPDCIP